MPLNDKTIGFLWGCDPPSPLDKGEHEVGWGFGTIGEC